MKKGEVKLFLIHAMKALVGSRGDIAPTHS
jgi:hypothetical protein